MGLIKNKVCDLKLEKSIEKVTVKTMQGTKQYEYQNAKLAKIEIKAKEIEGANITITYKITLTNEGEIASMVGKVIDYLPEGLNFNSKNNSNWKQQPNGQIINTSLANKKIEPGESIDLKVILTKQMTENSVGTFTNAAEIGEITNYAKIADKDSTPDNQNKQEDDYSEAEIIISVSTGLIIYLSIGIITIILIGIGVMLVSKYGILRIGKISLFVIIAFTMLLSGSKVTKAASPPMSAKFTYDKDGTLLGWVNEKNQYCGFVGGPETGHAKCTEAPKDAATGTFAFDSWVNLTQDTKTPKEEDDYSFSMTKQTTEVGMKIIGNDAIFGPMKFNTTYDTNYKIYVLDRDGVKIKNREFILCDEQGNKITDDIDIVGSGDISFCFRIPLDKCKNGISKIVVWATKWGTKKYTVKKIGQWLYDPGDVSAQKIMTVQTFNDEHEEEEIKSETHELIWTDPYNCMDIIKQDEDDSNEKLENVQIRLQCEAIGYDKTFTTNKEGKIRIENLPSNQNFVITEIYTPHYGYIPEVKKSIRVSSASLVKLDLKNTKHTGNLNLEKKDLDTKRPLKRNWI